MHKDESAKVTRRGYIADVMDRQGIHKNPRKYIVLRDWDTIVDHDMTYEVQAPAVPLRCEVGMGVYVISKPDSPDLVPALVVEDRGLDGVFVKPRDTESGVEFLVSREDVRMLPIPMRPQAILRRDLRLYIGDEAAATWAANRRARRK